MTHPAYRPAHYFAQKAIDAVNAAPPHEALAVLEALFDEAMDAAVENDPRPTTAFDPWKFYYPVYGGSASPSPPVTSGTCDSVTFNVVNTTDGPSCCYTGVTKRPISTWED